MFSKSCEYGLRAVIFIAEQSTENKKVGVKEIVEAIGSPEAFTAKILQLLTKNGIVDSVKGPNGGFMIPKEQLEVISLSMIVEVLDGDTIYTGCGLGLKQCDANSPCPLHHKFVDVRSRLKLMLESNTLHDILFTDNELNQFWLKR